ncbi:MAG: hypothetical protein K0U59_05410, partial [Gammaproteobacteria bacterium]|nr:hypothetical protein [Gammaproteobacteria bacterium]
MLHNSPENLNFPIDLTDRDGNKYRLSHWMRSESTWDDNIARNHQAAFAWLSNISGTQLHVIGNHFGILPHQRREWHSPHHANAARFWPMDEDNSSFYGSHSFDDGSDCPLEQMEYLQECFSSNTLILVRLDEPEKKDQRSLLRTKIQQAFASIVAQEKAEAAHHSQLLAKHTAAEAALIHTGAFFHGLWTAGTNFVEWVKNINALINPVQRRLRDIRSSYRALLRSNISGENFLTAYA